MKTQSVLISGLSMIIGAVGALAIGAHVAADGRIGRQVEPPILPNRLRR